MRQIINVFESRVIWLFTALLWIMLVVALTGCYTEKKATRQVVKAQVHHPQVVADICGSLYPPKEYRIDSIVVKQGETQYLPSDTVEIDCDTVREKSVVRIPCPPCPFRVDSFHHYTERKVENTAKITALQHDRQYLQSKYDTAAGQIKIFLWWAIAATVSTAVFAYLYFKK